VHPARPEPRSRAWLPAPAFVALAAALVAVLVIAGLSYRSLAARAEAAEAVNHTNDVEDHLHRFLSAMKDAETGQRGYLLTGVEAYLDPYYIALGAQAAELATLRRMTSGDAVEQRRLDIIEPLVKAKLDELEHTIALRRGGDIPGAVAIVQSDRGKATMDRLRDTIDAMLASEQALLQRRTDDWEATVTWSSYVMFGGVVIVIGMLLLIGVLASRDYRSVGAEGWARRVQLALTAQLQGDLRLESIGDKVLGILADNLGARVGALYVCEPGGELRRIAGHGLAASGQPGAVVRAGEGLTGQAAKDDRLVVVRDLPANYLAISSAVGNTTPGELVVAPASVDGTVQAVTELGFLHRLEPIELEVMRRVSEVIAVAIRTARDRSRLEEVLEELQRQTEELAAQQEELRVANEELEQHSRALQLSQTQLENQQAELEQINAQLEEQAQSLERQRDELTAAGAELQRSNEVKSQFLANMSHELRTPLNSSLILAKLLADNREGNLSDEQVRFARTIYSAGNDLLTLINDILDLSKIDAGMIDVRPEPIAIARLVDELTQTFQPVAAHKRLELAIRVDGSAPERIETDPVRLSQILKNLVSNALKFTERGVVSLDITAADGEVRFAVRDTGIGIAADQHEVIFDAFRQADGGNKRKFGGTGLGLSISRDLARLLGGSLALDSAPGRGSTFTLTLPARFVTPVPAPRATPGLPPVARQKPPSKPPAIVAPAPFPDDRDRLDDAARSLLIVEDDPGFARVLYDLARELEFLGVVATTAADGLALARQAPPSAIVLDIGLPDRSGLAVLDALKRDPATRHVPVHVVSASDYTQTALEMGAAGYALKPVERERLVDAIKHLEAKFTQKLRRVLIVEDDPVLRDATARLLAADDVEIVAAGTTAEPRRSTAWCSTSRCRTAAGSSCSTRWRAARSTASRRSSSTPAGRCRPPRSTSSSGSRGRSSSRARGLPSACSTR
jgi:signal transduction histidine kinase/CHASE3 domain sensor protein/DNA-binding NarL/FixJ family response regulator